MECRRIRQAERRKRAKSDPEAVERNRGYDRAYRLRNLEKRREAARMCARKRRAADPVPNREAVRKWRRENPDRRCIQENRRRARKLNSADKPVTALDIAAVRDRYRDELGIVRCAYCPSEGKTIDHVVPLARGGRDEISNLVPACKACNSSKGAKLLSEWRGPKAA